HTNCRSDHPHLHSFPTRRSSDLRSIRSTCRTGGPVRSRYPTSPATTPRSHARAPCEHVNMQHNAVQHVAYVGERHDPTTAARSRSEEHTSELQSRENLVCRLLLE